MRVNNNVCHLLLWCSQQRYPLSILMTIFPGGLGLAGTRNVSILDFTGAKDEGGGGDNWSYWTCKAPVKMSPPANQHPAFYRPDALPVAQIIVVWYTRV